MSGTNGAADEPIYCEWDLNPVVQPRQIELIGNVVSGLRAICRDLKRDVMIGGGGGGANGDAEYDLIFPFLRLPLEIRLEVYLHCNITILSYLAASSPLILQPEITRQLNYILKHSKVHRQGLGNPPVEYLRSVFEIMAEVMDEKRLSMMGGRKAEMERARRVGWMKWPGETSRRIR